MRRFAEPRDLAINLQGLEVLADEQTEIQHLRLFRHAKLGRVLVIGDEVQHVEAWQALYHEPLVHLPAAFLPEVGSVLVLGGGSLFAAYEALKYPTVARCTLVDHDARVIDLMARHYQHARKVISDPRFHYVVADALDYVRASTETFDLIINDCLDLTADPYRRCQPYGLLADRLAPGGVCSDLIYRDIFEPGLVALTRRTVGEIGTSIAALVFVPEYPGVLHALTIWGSAALSQSARRPLNRLQLQWCTGSRPDLAFYDPSYLPFHLYLPPLFQRYWATASGEKGLPEAKLL